MPLPSHAIAPRVGYIVNQYPAVSHSFIRREILALERLGVEVERFALRGWNTVLADPQDEVELKRTRFVLQQSEGTLAWAVFRELLAGPSRFFGALRLATRMAKGGDKSLPYHWVYFVEACLLARWSRAAGVRHIHAHFGTNSAEVAMLASMLCGASYSFTVHGPDEFDRPQAIGLGEKIRRATFVAAISSFTRSQLFRWVERPHWDKIQVVHCGLEAAFHAIPAVPAPTARCLVCVGRLSEQKGHLLLLAAMRLAFDCGCVFDLVLVGDGELRVAIEERVQALGLQAHVRLTGSIGSVGVRAELVASRALVLPSFAEGLPVVIMEAMSLRRPVITTFVAGIPELVRAGESGWLVPAGDAEALCAAIVDCLGASPERLDAMGACARERVVARHDIDIEAGKLADLLRAQLGAPVTLKAADAA